jgi:hypothetical protein
VAPFAPEQLNLGSKTAMRTRGEISSIHCDGLTAAHTFVRGERLAILLATATAGHWVCPMLYPGGGTPHQSGPPGSLPTMSWPKSIPCHDSPTMP